jgi:hypothetical protein
VTLDYSLAVIVDRNSTPTTGKCMTNTVPSSGLIMLAGSSMLGSKKGHCHHLKIIFLNQNNKGYKSIQGMVTQNMAL